MAKVVHDYRAEVAEQREVWDRKPALRKLYQHWYRRCVDALAPLAPSIEVGGGSGNFKQSCPWIISSDLFPTGPWVDLVMDAEALALRAARIGNIVAFDVLHHLQRPLSFLRDAATALKPRGRLVLCEPAVSTWSRFVYRFHHEPLDMTWDVFDEGPRIADPSHTFANMAIPELLMFRNRDRTLSMLNGMRIISAEKFGFLLYPMTGGFGYRSYVPETGLTRLLEAEDTLVHPFAKIVGMRMLVVLERDPN